MFHHISIESQWTPSPKLAYLLNTTERAPLDSPKQLTNTHFRRKLQNMLHFLLRILCLNVRKLCHFGFVRFILQDSTTCYECNNTTLHFKPERCEMWEVDKANICMRAKWPIRPGAYLWCLLHDATTRISTLPSLPPPP